MKKMYFGALLAIAGVLSTCVSEAQSLRRLNDRPKGDHTNSTLAEMRECRFVVPTATYMGFLAFIANDYLVNEGFVFDPADSMFHGRIEGYFDDVPIKPFTAGRMLTVWKNYTRVMRVEFGDTMYTFGIDANLKFADAPRLQKTWEDYFVVLDLADLPGFEQAKAIGWHRIFVLASCWCANPIMWKCLRQDPAPPPMQASSIERSELKLANQSTGGVTNVYNHNIVNSGNTTIASAAPPPPMNGYYAGGGYPMYSPAPPMMVMPNASPVCRMQYEGEYQQCGEYRLPRGCNQPKQRYQKPVYPVRPVQPDKPTVRNVKIHQDPGFTTQTDGVTVVKDHDAPGTGGTTRNGGRPSLNPDAPPATIDMPRGAYGSGARVARERYAAPYDQPRKPTYGSGYRSMNRSMDGGRQMPSMQQTYRQQPMRPAMQAAPRQYPQPSGMRMYGNAGSGYRQAGGFSRGGGGRR